MRHDLRCALRTIVSHRWFSAAVVATLALGIGLNTMVFTLINAVLFKAVPLPGGARLVSIVSHKTNDNDMGMPVSYADFLDYRAQSRSYEALEANTDEPGVLSELGNPPQSFHLAHATTGIFSMLHTNAILGRALQLSDEQPTADPVVVIAYNVWQDRYGRAPSVIGRKVRVSGKPATIVGVMPNGFKFPTSVDLWMPLIPTTDLQKRDNRSVHPYSILKRGVSLRQAQSEIDAITARLAAMYPDDKDIGAQVLTFQQRFNGGGIRVVFLLMLGAVGFVLLIACADVANMMLSRSLDRQREMAIRTALGATRWRVMRQLLVESLLLSITGGILGLGLAELGIRWFDKSTIEIRPYWIQFTLDPTVIAWFAGLCVLAALLFGTVPALRSSLPDMNEIMKEGGRTAGRRRGAWLSSTLVVFQFALTLVLLTGAGIFVRSLFNNLTVNASVPSHQLWTARVGLPDGRYKDGDARQRFFDQLLPRLRSMPGVSNVSITSVPPGLGSWHHQVELEHHLIEKPAQRPWVALVANSPGYFDTIHVPILRGRDFTALDGAPGHESAILPRETASKLWPGEDPIGKRFRIYGDKDKPGPWVTVVGICASFVQELVNTEPQPALFVPYRQEGWDSMFLMIESSANPIPAAGAVVQNLDQDLPLTDVFRLDEAIQHQAWFLRVFGGIFFGFALIALVMASVGIYAVMAHAAARRTQEIGVRMALGASAGNIVALVMRRGLWQIAAGVAAGLAAGLPVSRLMKSLPLGASSTDPAIFLTVSTVLAAVGILACWLPARRAAALDPVKAIRYE